MAVQSSYKPLGCLARPFGIIDKLYIFNSNMSPAACGKSWLGPLDATTVGQQVLLKGPPVGGGEGRPRISLLEGPPKVGGEGKLPGEVGGKLAATD